MSGRGKELFNQLRSAESIKALMGQSEDAHSDCKEWPTSDGDAQKVFAKAACGLTNAEGGVVLVGMKARPMSKDEPDLVDSAAPVADTSAVKSRILDLVGQLVEPGIQGLQAAEVNEPAGSKSGFVVVYIPASEGLPRRSRKDWKFYLRIGSGTFPMEYFQIEERFGKRPPPKLELYLEPDGIRGATFAPRTVRAGPPKSRVRNCEISEYSLPTCIRTAP
jgi:predicted HTH transcriptional regulator